MPAGMMRQQYHFAQSQHQGRLQDIYGLQEQKLPIEKQVIYKSQSSNFLVWNWIIYVL